MKALTIASVANRNYVAYLPGFISSAAVSFERPEIMLATSPLQGTSAKQFQNAVAFAESRGAVVLHYVEQHEEFFKRFSPLLGRKNLLGASSRWLLPVWSEASGRVVFFTDVDTFFVPGTDWQLDKKVAAAKNLNGLAYSYRRHESRRVAGGAHLVLNPEYFEKTELLLRRLWDDETSRLHFVASVRTAAASECRNLDDEYVLGELLSMILDLSGLVSNEMAQTDVPIPGLHLGIGRLRSLPKTDNVQEARHAASSNPAWGKAAQGFGTVELYRILGNKSRRTLPQWDIQSELRYRFGMLRIHLQVLERAFIQKPIASAGRYLLKFRRGAPSPKY